MTRWVADPDSLRTLVAELCEQPVYGIDTEFHRERTYYPHLALVQIAWPGHVALVDPLAVDVAPLGEVFAGPRLAVAHAADQDLEVLDRACGTVPTRLFDTQVAAGFLGYSSPSLATLVERSLGTHLTKGDRLTDWTRRPLSDAQKRYAAADVDHLLALHARISSRLEEFGRLAWAEEECELLRERSHQPQDPETAWWRIKETRSLRGAARGVAQEVAAWRERRAAEVDRPPRTILPDLAILGIAHRQPTGAGELREMRGLDARHLRGGAADEVLAAVAAGLRLPREALRLPVVDDLDRVLRPAVTLVSAWVAQLAHDLKIEAALLATRADLVAFLRGDPTARLANGWRSELLGRRVRQLVDGEAALAFRPGRGDLVLEVRSKEELPVEIPVPDDEDPPPAH
ncbi:MAG TPA: HRDC domain-containing protein [Acidimicrobiales bacterium]|nr:HRDC domain-containing protein [Acidimicrobiales bacterium]